MIGTKTFLFSLLIFASITSTIAKCSCSECREILRGSKGKDGQFLKSECRKQARKKSCGGVNSKCLLLTNDANSGCSALDACTNQGFCAGKTKGKKSNCNAMAMMKGVGKNVKTMMMKGDDDSNDEEDDTNDEEDDTNDEDGQPN